MNKVIVCEAKNGERAIYVVRQMAHDKQYKVGMKYFGSVIVEIREQ